MTDKRVYFLRPVGQLGPVKIGCSKLPELRLDSFTIWSPVRLELVVSVPGTHSDERALHGLFAKHHLHGEWFGASKELLALIDHCREHGELPPLPKVVKFPKTAHVGFKGRKAKGAKAKPAPKPKVFEGDRELGAALRPRYEAGVGLQALADEEGCSIQRVRRLLVIAGAEIRPRGGPAIKRGVADKARADAMRDRYLGGETLEQIGQDYGITRERVRQILRKTDVPSLGRRVEHCRQAHELTDDEKEAARLYDEGIAPRELQARFNLKYGQIRAAVVRCGYEVKPLGTWNSREDDEEITASCAELYQQGLSAKEIIAHIPQLKFPAHVYRYLRKAGIQPHHRSRKGAAEAHASAIIAAYHGGKTIAQVADFFGFSKRAIDNLLKRHGAKLSRGESEARRVAAVRRANAARSDKRPAEPSSKAEAV